MEGTAQPLKSHSLIEPALSSPVCWVGAGTSCLMSYNRACGEIVTVSKTQSHPEMHATAHSGMKETEKPTPPTLSLMNLSSQQSSGLLSSGDGTMT